MMTEFNMCNGIYIGDVSPVFLMLNIDASNMEVNFIGYTLVPPQWNAFDS